MNAYPITNTWRKRHYVARLARPHPRYIVDREFLRGRPIKSRGIVTYDLADIGDPLPAWLIRADDNGRREVIAAYPEGWETLGALTSTGMLAVYEAGPPGTSDAWHGEYCHDCHDAPTFPPGPPYCDKCQEAMAGRQAAAALAGDKPNPF